MPDQYFYVNGTAATIDGGSTTSLAPVMRGDFQSFSATPDPNNDFPLWPNPFGPCGAATAALGQPVGPVRGRPHAGRGREPLDRALLPGQEPPVRRRVEQPLASWA